MTVYVIVQLKMIDRAAYDRYQARFFDVFKKFNGRLLSADENPTILEGGWDRDKLVLMSFPDEAAFQAWANSPEYLEISKDRKAGAEGVVLLAKGFAPGGRSRNSIRHARVRPAAMTRSTTWLQPRSPPRPVAKPKERKERRRRVVRGPVVIIGPIDWTVDVAMMMPDAAPRAEVALLHPFAVFGPRSAMAPLQRNGSRPSRRTSTRPPEWLRRSASS